MYSPHDCTTGSTGGQAGEVAQRASGVHPKVVSDILGHKKVNLAMDVYDRTEIEDFVQPLAVVFNELLPSCYPERSAATNQR